MPRPPSSTRAGFALALVSASSFGVLPIFAKLAFDEGVDVGALLFWRFGLACVVLWTVVAARAARPGGPLAVPRRRAARLFALGLLYAVNSAFYFLALYRIPASTTSLIFYVYPALVALLGIAWLRRPVRLVKLAALATTLTGVFLTVGFSTGPLDPLGVALALASAGVLAVYLVLSEAALAGLPTLRATAFVVSGTALAFLAAELVRGGLVPPPTAVAWLLVGIMATVSTALSIVAMLGAVGRLGSGTTAIVSTLEPAITTALATLVLGERMAPRQLLGAALILAGVLFLRFYEREPAPILADA